MKKILFIFAFITISISYAQVGINTDDPQATLEIAVDPNRDNNDNTEVGTPNYINGGMILGFPGKKNNYISSMDVPGILELQNQQILMRNATTGQVDYMDRYAIDYFPARPSHQLVPGIGYIPIEINEKDHTILVRNNISLPNGSEYIGKTLFLIYDSQENTPFKISGAMKYNAFLTNELYISRVNSGYILQSDGTKWFVVGGFEQEDNKKVELVTLYTDDVAKVTDNKILVKGNISLPTAAVAGYELTLTYNGNGSESFTINASTSPIKDGSSTVSTYILSKANNSKSVKLQSDGTNWVVMAKR